MKNTQIIYVVEHLAYVHRFKNIYIFSLLYNDYNGLFAYNTT